MRLPAATALLPCLLISKTTFAQVNVTVDDTNSTITYSPQNKWNQGDTCVPGCTAQPALRNLITNHTWKDVDSSTSDSTHPTITFQFQGVGIYAFGIMAPTEAGGATNTTLSFMINGTDQGTFHYDSEANTTAYTPPGGSKKRDGLRSPLYARQQPTIITAGYTYQVPLFGKANMQPGTHTLVIQVTGNSLFLFDSLKYTMPQQRNKGGSPGSSGSNNNDSQSSGSKTPIGAIVGGVVGGVVALAALVGLFIFLRRRRASSQRERLNQADIMREYEYEPYTSSANDRSGAQPRNTRQYEQPAALAPNAQHYEQPSAQVSSTSLLRSRENITPFGSQQLQTPPTHQQMPASSSTGQAQAHAQSYVTPTGSSHFEPSAHAQHDASASGVEGSGGATSPRIPDPSLEPSASRTRSEEREPMAGHVTKLALASAEPASEEDMVPPPAYQA